MTLIKRIKVEAEILQNTEKMSKEIYEQHLEIEH